MSRQIGYEVGGDRVRYGTKAIRGADAKSFEVLLLPWARDRASVYFEGRKVSKAVRDTFRALTANVACDAKRVFHAHPSGHVFDTTCSRKDGFDATTARALEHDGRAFLVSDRVWALQGFPVGLGLDAKTFESLGQGYCRDQTKVVWIPLATDGRPTHAEGADAATFVVDASGARDRHGLFVSGARDADLLPVQREVDPRAAATRIVESLWQECILRWFADFDRSIVTNDGIVRVGSPAATPTRVPSHRLHIEGARLLLEVGERTCEGTVSGMELLAGWLDGIARGKVLDDRVCVRVMLRTDGEIVSTEGTPPCWQRCIDLAYLFERLKLRQEALFLLQRVQRWKPTALGATTPGDSAVVRSEKLLGGLVGLMPAEAIPKGSTTQAAMAWMVDQQLHRSADALVRRDVASSVGALAQATTVDPARLTALAGPVLSLLDDPEPAVRAEACASFELLGSRCLNKQAHEEALVVLEALAARDINLDMQSARRWQCLAALGRGREAEQAWEMCRRLSANDPLVKPTLGTSYSGFDAWRKAREASLPGV